MVPSPWGWSATFDCRACNNLVSNEKALYDWVVELVKRINMVSFGEPLIEHFGEGNKTGYTVVQLIQTSNITGHFVDESGDGYIDVFSCKPFDLKTVENVINEFFNPKNIRANMVERFV